MRLTSFRPVLAILLLASCAAPQPSASGARLTEFSGGVPSAAAGSRAGDQRMIGRLAGGAPFATAEATGNPAERAAVTAVLSDLQSQSFARNAEFCGYLGLDAAGQYVTSAISGGEEASCSLPAPPTGMTVIASFHTHGGYSPEFQSEIPTALDMLSDQSANVDGYISTPGGRLWYVDSDTMIVRQVCGRGCLPQDPRYVAADDGPVRDSFTLMDLQRLERG